MPAVELKTLINAVCKVASDKQTLQIAEWVMMELPGRQRAQLFLHHYLEGSGRPIMIDVAEFMRECPVLANKVFGSIRASLARGVRAGSIPLRQSAFGPGQSEQDWRYAVGSLNMEWRMPSQANRRKTVELWFNNQYRWHPNEAKRISACVHQAADRLKSTGARDFWMQALPKVMELPEDQPQPTPPSPMGPGQSAGKAPGASALAGVPVQPRG